MAANVVDEVVDIETDGNLDEENFSDKIEQGVADEVHRFPFQLPPPPPLPRKFYLQVRLYILYDIIINFCSSNQRHDLQSCAYDICRDLLVCYILFGLVSDSLKYC